MTIKLVYLTSCGSIFDTQEEAEEHEWQQGLWEKAMLKYGYHGEIQLDSYQAYNDLVKFMSSQA